MQRDKRPDPQKAMFWFTTTFFSDQALWAGSHFCRRRILSEPLKDMLHQLRNCHNMPLWSKFALIFIPGSTEMRRMFTYWGSLPLNYHFWWVQRLRSSWICDVQLLLYLFELIFHQRMLSRYIQRQSFLNNENKFWRISSPDQLLYLSGFFNPCRHLNHAFMALLGIFW